jgi:hypothetical protein
VSRLLANRLEDEQGKQADLAEVAEVVRAKAEELDHARITEFVPLLTERKARDELRSRGLHPRWENPLGHRQEREEQTGPPARPAWAECETVGCGGMIPVSDGAPGHDPQRASAAVTCPVCGIEYAYFPPLGDETYLLVAKTSGRV